MTDPGLTAWLVGHVEGLVPPLTFSLLAGGLSNLTYRIVDGAGATFVLRRPPRAGVLHSAHDMSREWRFLVALAPTAVPVPLPLAFCDDRSIAGADFYVMSDVDGLVLADEQSGSVLPEAARRRAGFELIDALVVLHEVDPTAVRLEDYRRSGSYVGRQLRRWQRHVHESGAPGLGLLDEVHDALLVNVPDEGSGIVHGDFKAGNVAFDPLGRVLAIFDWELATLGESLADLGWLMASWAEPGDRIAPTTASPSAAGGFPSRTEMVARYGQRSGRDLSDLPYYVAFSRWRSACIAAGVQARYKAGLIGAGGEVRAETYLAQQAGQGEAAFEALEELGLVAGRGR